MSDKKVLHIATCDKFIPPFIELLKENFNFYQHFFLLLSGFADSELQKDRNIFVAKRAVFARIKFYFLAIIKMHSCKKIILHGLFDFKIVLILFFMPWLLKKCYWIMWGGDLYDHQLGTKDSKWKAREFFRRPVIKNMGFLVNGTPGDVELARKWYGAKGKHIRCFNYTSNVYTEYDVPEKQHSGVNIMVGNSADPTNNHFEVFNQLETFKNQGIQIFVPLTYGNQDYAQKVVAEGKKRFGEKFKPLTEHMPYEKYLEFLGFIDIAIFNHRRQQAFGNKITLLGLGKKVYLRPDSTLNGVFEEFNIKTFNIENFELVKLPSEVAYQNRLNTIKIFSKQALVKSLSSWIQ